MPFPPNLFLVGAQKAGTTYLATLLGQHPDVCLAKSKEPDFFTRNWDKGEKWYRDEFASPESRFLLDASTGYSAAPLEKLRPGDTPSRMADVPARIAALSPDARFIYLLRDPVKRVYSSYWHSVRGGYEQRPFSEVIRNDTYYLRMGCYYRQLQHYWEYFDPDRFQILFFEDFIKAPEKVANHCLTSLGLAPLSEYVTPEGKNETYVYGPFLSRVNQLLAKMGGVGALTGGLKHLLPVTLLRRLRRSVTTDIPPMSEGDRAWLVNYYAGHNFLLESKLGLDLPSWIRP